LVPRQLGGGVASLLAAAILELGSQLFERPMHDAVRGVVQHLPDDLAADAWEDFQRKGRPSKTKRPRKAAASKS